jgi:hypothetical protein
MMRLHRMTFRPLFAALLIATMAMVAAPVRAAFIDLTPSGGSNSSSSVSLADLISGAVSGITVGDKVFTGFSYSTLSADMPKAVSVSVEGFKDMNGNWGVTFQGAFMDLPGGDPSSDAQIGFDVAVNATGIANGLRISDAHLFLDGANVGGPNSSFIVDESFAQQFPSLPPLVAQVTTFGPGITKLSDSANLTPPVKMLHVFKDINAIAGAGSIAPARGTVISQSFSQTQIVPEPAVAVLSLLGMVGFVCKRNRQRG